MAVNKVTINTTNGEEVLIDLTGDTVTPETLAEGIIAHDASGKRIMGTVVEAVFETWTFTMENGSTVQKKVNVNA